MAHTERCGNSAHPASKCRCSCGGSEHGLSNSTSLQRPAAGEQADQLANYLRTVSTPHAAAHDSVRTQLFKAKQAELAAMPNTQPRPDLSGPQFAEAMVSALEPDGGFTIDPRTGQSMTTGFFVSPHPELERAVQAQDLTVSDLANFIHDNQAILQRPGNFLGGWHDPETGIISLDISTRTETAQQARTIAAEHQQVAFFDAQTFESVTVNAEERYRIEAVSERKTHD